MIGACITDRIDTIGAIMDVAVRLGFTRGHIAHTLKQDEGHHWRCDREGIYTLL